MSCECDTTVNKVHLLKKKKLFFPCCVFMCCFFLQLLCCMWKDRMFTTQKYLPWRHPERARFLLSARLTSSHPVRVLVLSAPLPPPNPPLPPPHPSYIHSVSRKQECEEFMFPPLEGCMLCFIRVESHDNLGMNIWDSVQTTIYVLVCSSVCSELRELPVCRSEHPVIRREETDSSILGQRRGNRSRAGNAPIYLIYILQWVLTYVDVLYKSQLYKRLRSTYIYWIERGRSLSLHLQTSVDGKIHVAQTLTATWKSSFRLCSAFQYSVIVD